MFPLLVCLQIFYAILSRDECFEKLPPGKMLTSLVWFSSPFASHKNISWMAPVQKYAQGCVKAAFLIGNFQSKETLICNNLYQGLKKEQNGRKRDKRGVRSPVLGHFEASAAHLLGLFIFGRALENLSIAASVRDPSPFQPLTPLFLTQPSPPILARSTQT